METFSVRKARHRELVAVADREEAGRACAALAVCPADFLVSQLTALVRAPTSSSTTLALAVGRADPGLRGRLWGVFYFAEAMLGWYAARRRDVRHLHAMVADVASDVALIVTRGGSNGRTWSLAVHILDEFCDVQLNRLAEKLAADRLAIAISDSGPSQVMGRWSRAPLAGKPNCSLWCRARSFWRRRRQTGVRRTHIQCVGQLVASEKDRLS